MTELGQRQKARLEQANKALDLVYAIMTDDDDVALADLGQRWNVHVSFMPHYKLINIERLARHILESEDV